jgi:hypothetical protein
MIKITLPRASYSWGSRIYSPFFWTWIIRPCIGMVSLRTASASSDKPVCRRELIPRSDKARLIDLEKLSGVVSGSRRSIHVPRLVSEHVLYFEGTNRVSVRKFLHGGLGRRHRELRESQLVQLPLQPSFRTLLKVSRGMGGYGRDWGTK